MTGFVRRYDDHGKHNAKVRLEDELAGVLTSIYEFSAAGVCF